MKPEVRFITAFVFDGPLMRRSERHPALKLLRADLRIVRRLREAGAKTFEGAVERGLRLREQAVLGSWLVRRDRAVWGRVVARANEPQPFRCVASALYRRTSRR